MNWSEYSRFVGDIFGAPLAIEALLAFFLESTFLGIWIFGWDKLSKRLHAGDDLAGGHRLQPLGPLDPDRQLVHAAAGGLSSLRNGRAEMTDFLAPCSPTRTSGCSFRTWSSPALTTAAFFVLGISAYHLLRKSRQRRAVPRARSASRWCAA